MENGWLKKGQTAMLIAISPFYQTGGGGGGGGRDKKVTNFRAKKNYQVDIFQNI